MPSIGDIFMGLERERDTFIIPRYYIVRSANASRITICLLREDGTPSHLNFAYENFKNENGVNVIRNVGSRKSVLHPFPNSNNNLHFNCKAIPISEAVWITSLFECLGTQDKKEVVVLKVDEKTDTYETRPVPVEPPPKPLTKMQEEMLAERKRRRKMYQEREKKANERIKQKRLKNTPTFPHSMECAEYDEARLSFPCIAQPKMDGCRIRITKDEGKVYILTRSNRVKYEWYNIQGIAWDIIPEGTLIEGEFWSPKLTWQKIVGKFSRKQDKMVEWMAEGIRFTMFDMINIDRRSPRLPYAERYNRLKKVFAQKDNFKTPYHSMIEVVEGQVCKDKDELDAVFDAYLKAGYEGCVIRTFNGLYDDTGKRTPAVMKRKPYVDDEFKIIDMCMVGSDKVRVELQCADETKTFGAMWNASREELQDIIRNKENYKGKLATVRYVALTDSGIPRSGEIKGIRNIEDDV